jgi:hypothetical protein
MSVTSVGSLFVQRGITSKRGSITISKLHTVPIVTKNLVLSIQVEFSINLIVGIFFLYKSVSKNNVSFKHVNSTCYLLLNADS